MRGIGLGGRGWERRADIAPSPPPLFANSASMGRVVVHPLFVSSLFVIVVIRTLLKKSSGVMYNLTFGLSPVKSLQVRKVVILDGFGYFYVPPGQLAEVLRVNMTRLLRLEEKDVSEQRSYTEEEVICLYTEGTSFGYLPTDVRTLMKRGCRSDGGGRFLLTRDPCLRAIFWNAVERTAALKFLRGYKNDMLVIDALPGLGARSVMHDKIRKQCGHRCRSFKILELEGNHHLHMNQADLVAEHIRPFLLEGS